jgi:AraC-like DNA-binding protein
MKTYPKACHADLRPVQFGPAPGASRPSGATTAVTLRVGMEAGFSPLSDTLRLPCRGAETPNFGNEIVVRNLLWSLFVYFMRELGRRHFSGSKRLVFDCALAADSADSRAHAQGTLTCVDTRELSQEAGLSRAAFARIFSASVGEPPHSYELASPANPPKLIV